MFTDFLYLLRRSGLKVSLTEWMTLMEALHHNLHDASFTGFYHPVIFGFGIRHQLACLCLGIGNDLFRLSFCRFKDRFSLSFSSLYTVFFDLFNKVLKLYFHNSASMQFAS